MDSNLTLCKKQVTYSKTRYLELLEKQAENNLTKAEKIKLLYFGGSLSSTLVWETREEIFKLLKQVLEDKISIGKFCGDFEERAERTNKSYEILEENKIILPTSQTCINFTELLEEIHDWCEEAGRDGLDINSTAKNPLTSVKFKEEIKKIYDQLQKLCDD